jgi:hypothetical protein
MLSTDRPEFELGPVGTDNLVDLAAQTSYPWLLVEPSSTAVLVALAPELVIDRAVT